jgi:hypothetical protein
MLTILGITLSYETIAWFVLFIASEYIGMNPKWKENSVLQMIVKIALLTKGVRVEDDKIEDIKRTLRGGR